jgi:hypothetical protein
MNNVTEAVVTVLVVAIVVGLPMFALTLRFAFKPLLEAYMRLREVSIKPTTELEALRVRVAALEAVWENRLGGGSLEPTNRAPASPDRARS